MIPPSPVIHQSPPVPALRSVSLNPPSDSSSVNFAASPTSPSISRHFRRPTASQVKIDVNANRGFYETQKLFAYLLGRLEARQQAPGLLERAAIQARHVGAKGKGKGRVGKLGRAFVSAAQSSLVVGQGGPSGEGVGSDDYEITLEEGESDNDATHDLVEQTRDLLVIADRQHLDLFGSEAMTPAKTKGCFPPSPTNTNAELLASGSSLLSRTIQILRSLLTIDSLHRTHLFRPLRPPNALQAACLDIATYLYYACGLETKLEVVGTVIDGFHAMPDTLVERVCEWLEGRLGELLGRLARERGGSSDSTSMPTIAISQPETTTPGWMRLSPATPSFPFPHAEITGLLSTHTADTSDLSLYIASLVARTLAAVTELVDLTFAKLSTIHRVHRLISVILTAKSDAPLDLLEIVALSQPSARRAAAEILSTFYPHAMGHNYIARRLASTTYASQRAKWETGNDRVLGEDAEDHHYIPWRMSAREGASSCSTCSQGIHGFCIRCTLCRDATHLQCYRPADMFSYEVVTLSSRETTPRTANVKFSKCLSQLDEQVLAARGITRRRIGQHNFHLINLFTLTLCDHCHEPLWGSRSQAYACMNGCQRLFHLRCADHVEVSCKYGRDVVIDESLATGRNPFAITLSVLRASFDREVGNSDVTVHSYDELAVLYGALWTQYQVLKNGISSGSLRVSDTSTSDPLSLRPIMQSYETYLQIHNLEASSAAANYAHVSGSDLLGQGYLFSDRYLTYCTALLRAPSHALTHETLLNGAEPNVPESVGAYELLELATLRWGLAYDLNIHDERIAAIFLDQLRSTGLCTVKCHSIRAEDVVDGRIWCSFTLPLLIDSSPTVELLILAIEALLDDLDLTMNEQAFNLLCTRAWPSLLCSPYALERLGNAVVSWVMAQVCEFRRTIADVS